MRLSLLVALLTFLLPPSSLAWVPRAFDQDASKTRQYGVLAGWQAHDAGVMMSPEMVSIMDKPLETHQVPVFYDDEFADADGLYPPHTKHGAFSVGGSGVPTHQRMSSYNLYHRGKPSKAALAPTKKHKRSEEEMIERYRWPRPMDRANNRANLEHTENGIRKPRERSVTAHPNDF